MDSSILRDLVVTLLIEESSKAGNSFTFDVSATPIEGCSPEEIERVLQALATEGFINYDVLMHHNCLITLNQSIFDLKERGGYSMQIDFLKLQYDKLQLEVEKLEKEVAPQHMGQTSTFRNIVGTLDSIINIVSTLIQSIKIH